MALFPPDAMLMLMKPFCSSFAPCNPCQPLITSLPMSLEARVAKLEDGLSDWSATTRARWEGMKALDERMQALVKTKTGLWQVKDELFNLVMVDLDPLLSHVPDPNHQMQLRAELREVLSAREDIVGVFPVQQLLPLALFPFFFLLLFSFPFLFLFFFLCDERLALEAGLADTTWSITSCRLLLSAPP